MSSQGCIHCGFLWVIDLELLLITTILKTFQKFLYLFVTIISHRIQKLLMERIYLKVVVVEMKKCPEHTVKGRENLQQTMNWWEGGIFCQGQL